MKTTAQISTLGILSLALAVIMIQPVYGYANTFLEDDTLIITDKGEYCIYLQNTGDLDAAQKIEISQGAEYIKNVDDVNNEFNIPANTISDDFPVCMELELPSKPGTEKYLIEYGVGAADKSNGDGMISFKPIQIKTQFYITATTVKSSNIGFKVLGALVIVGALFGVREFKQKKKPVNYNQQWNTN